MADIVSLQEKAEVFHVILATVIAVIPTFSMGTALGFSNPAAVQYKQLNATALSEPLTQDQTSWFVSLLSISLMVGTLFSGPIADRFGRRYTTLASQCIMLAGWICMLFAKEFSLLMIGRFFTGLGAGVSMPASYMILSEIALVRFRGTLAIINTLIPNICFIYILFLSALFPFDWMIPFSCLPILVFFALFYFIPESPLWFVKQGRMEEAQKTMSWLRGPNYPVAIELDEMQACLAEESHDDENEEKPSVKDKLNYLMSRPVLAPLVMMTGMFILQTVSGSDTVAFYSLDIFQRAQVPMDNHLLSSLVQIGFILGYILSTPLLSKIPRRLQFIMSALFMALSFTTLGFSLDAMTIENEQGWISYYNAVLPVCVISAGLAYGLGVGPVLVSLLAEVLPSRIKGLCCSIVISAKHLVSFVNLKVFPSLVAHVGLPSVFWIHSGILVFACGIAFLVLPETQGKTLTELSNLYKKEGQKKQLTPQPQKLLTKAEKANVV